MKKRQKQKAEPSLIGKKGVPLGVFIISLFLIIFLIIFFLPIIPISYPMEKSVSEEVPLRYTVISADYSGGFKGLNWVIYGRVQLRNDDDQPGTFVVNCYFKTLDETLTDSVKVYILPGEVKQVTCTGDIKFGQDVRFYYDVQPSKKIISRTITTTTTKAVSLFQILIGVV